jgi:hypothetical protein
MAEPRVTSRQARGSTGRNPGRPGRLLLPDGVWAGQRLARARFRLEPGHIRDAGDGLLGGRGMREAGPGLLCPRGVPLPARACQGVQRDTAGVLSQCGQGGQRRARGDPGLDHRADRVLPGGGEGQLIGGDRAAALALPQRPRGRGLGGQGGGGAGADQLGGGPEVRSPASVVLSSPNVVSDAGQRDWYAPRTCSASTVS